MCAPCNAKNNNNKKPFVVNNPQTPRHIPNPMEQQRNEAIDKHRTFVNGRVIRSYEKPNR